ncbi:MAG: EAL domain-containing protein [Deltaproteobacteria bacterium]|nr:EAL domain-containing protein [Deltaproteobacteria bacterium]
MSSHIPTILVADLDAAYVDVAAKLVAERGFTVVPARGLAAARLALETHHFDAIVADLGLATSGGGDLLDEVRKRDLDVPVLLMTGEPVLHTAVLAVEEGAAAYLVKPLRRHSLFPALDRALRLGALSRLKREALELLGDHDHSVGDRGALKVRFERALETVAPAWQPVVDAEARRVIGYEALLRSQEPTLPNPGSVVAAAERLGRVLDVGRALRRRVAGEASLLPADAMIFINLHPRDLADPDLLDTGSPFGALAHRVVLEVTERATLDSVDDVKTHVSRLRGLGFRLAVDDLGAGYAGLNSVVQLEPEVVKLDLGLVRGLDHDATRRRVVGSMVELASRLGMQAVGEGVETAGESGALLELGCHWQQGFFFGRPGRAGAPARFG